jgi:L-threonylcarbamoyladenylate synthase
VSGRDWGDEIAAAAELLRGGGLVAFPTETVYGLGADATNVAALGRLYAVKGRPADHPVIVHLADARALDDWAAVVPDSARALADAFCPGPLTLIVRRSARVPDAVTGGRDTVGLRVPDQPVALALLRAFGGGVAAPSANRFGRVSPTTAADVRADLGVDVDLVLDGGPCRVGVESTIVDCTADPPVIARVGGVPREAVEAALGRPVAVADQGTVAAPGTLAAHYAPRARVHVVDAATAGARAAELLGAGRRVGMLALEMPVGLPPAVEILDAPADVNEYARVLYVRLREADTRALDDLLVVPPPAAGLGAAVVDRVGRAARAEPGP